MLHRLRSRKSDLANRTGTFAIILLSFIALTLLSVSPVWAAPEFRVAYVDLQKALASSKQGQKAQKQYEADVKKAQSKLDEKKTEFEALTKSFRKQRESLNETARAEKEEELIAMEKDLKRSLRDAQEKLQRKNAVLVGDLVKEIRKVVEEVGRAEGFTIILEKGSQAVLYADNKIDITDKVVQAFDKLASK